MCKVTCVSCFVVCSEESFAGGLCSLHFGRFRWQSEPAFHDVAANNSCGYFLTIDEMSRWLEVPPSALREVLLCKGAHEEFMHGFGAEKRVFGAACEQRFCVQGCGCLARLSERQWMEFADVSTTPFTCIFFTSCLYTVTRLRVRAPFASECDGTVVCVLPRDLSTVTASNSSAILQHLIYTRAPFFSPQGQGRGQRTPEL